MNSGEIEYWCQSNTPSKAESCCNFFLGLFAFMIQPEVQIISDVGMIRKATNRYPEINNLSNRKAPSVYGTLGSLMKDALSVLDRLLTAVSLSGSPEYERNA